VKQTLDLYLVEIGNKGKKETAMFKWTDKKHPVFWWISWPNSQKRWYWC